MVTAKATAAGGAPTSALAVESESKRGREEGGTMQTSSDIPFHPQSNI